jgi:hypothetical protein
LKQANKEIIMSQNAILTKHLTAGNTITSSEARERYGIRNLRARINDLRNQGYCVYTNRNNGTTSYRIGRASRAIVSAAYQVVGASIFR